jgi:hypothetical protein
MIRKVVTFDKLKSYSDRFIKKSRENRLNEALATRLV